MTDPKLIVKINNFLDENIDAYFKMHTSLAYLLMVCWQDLPARNKLHLDNCLENMKNLPDIDDINLRTMPYLLW